MGEALMALSVLAGVGFGGELHDAAKAGDVARVKELIAAGADINAKDKDDHTPVDRAARSGHIEVVRVLLDRGAKVTGSAYHWSLTRYPRIAILIAAGQVDPNGREVPLVAHAGMESQARPHRHVLLALRHDGDAPCRREAVEGVEQSAPRGHPAAPGGGRILASRGCLGADGGRVYSTAMMVLALETGYRHARSK